MIHLIEFIQNTAVWVHESVTNSKLLTAPHEMSLIRSTLAEQGAVIDIPSTSQLETEQASEL